MSNNYVPANPGAFTPAGGGIPAPFGTPASGLSAGSFTAPVPANAPAAGADTNALYGAFHMFSWREVGFPVTEFDTEVRHDIIVHKFADKDGSHAEDQGRAALQITAHIPFVNGLTQGPNETWSRPLYPFTWRQFFAAAAQSGSGTLVHPEFGQLTCKLQSFKTSWTGTARGGPTGIATWIESDDTGIDLDTALSEPSPLAQAAGAAADMDAALAALQAEGFLTQLNDAIPRQLPAFTSSFSDLVSGITAVVDLPSLLANQSGGQINAILYQAQTLENALNQQGKQTALNWPIFQAAEQMKSAAYDLQQTLLTKGRAVGLYQVVGDKSLSQIAAAIPANIADLMTLNPMLVQNPIVLDRTAVRFYLPGA